VLASPWLALPTFLGIALFARLYNFALFSWVPDSYERLESVERLLAGDFPLSDIYPPGATLVLAPFLAVLPDTIGSLQAVVAGAGALVVAIGYLAMRNVSDERIAPLFFALLLAVSPAFVYVSRIAVFDIFAVLLLAPAVFLATPRRRQSYAALVAYGALLALLINLRPTVAAGLPALFLAWAYATSGTLSLSALVRTACSREVITAAATLVAASGLMAVGGGWTGNAGSAQLSFASVPGNTLRYASILFDGPLLVFTLPLALVGFRKLWRLSRPLAIAIGLIILIWPLAHSPFPFVSGRYMMPARFFLYFLIALAPAELLDYARSATARRALWLRLGLGFAAGVILFFYLASSATIVANWPAIAAASDEGLLREVRPVIGALEGRPLIVTAVARGLEETDAGYFDLLGHSLAYGNAGRPDLVVAAAASALQSGRPAYYLHTHWEDGKDLVGDGSQRYAAYFDAVANEFQVTEAWRSEGLRAKKYSWVLYELAPR
jgi:hypothetical protein